jgi:diguanylate cyclase (GGDEF)-like protein
MKNKNISATKLEEAVDRIGFVVYEINQKDSTVTFFSKCIYKLSGIPLEDFSNKISWFDIIVDEDRKKVLNHYFHNKNKNRRIQYKIKDKKNKLKRILDDSFFLYDSHKKPNKIIGILRDITTIHEENETERILNDFSKIINNADSVYNAAQGFLRIFCNEFSFMYGEVWLLDDQKKNVYCLSCYLLKNNEKNECRHDVFPINKFSLKILNNKEAVQLNPPIEGEEFYIKLNTKYDKILGIRLFSENETIGFVIFFTKKNKLSNIRLKVLKNAIDIFSHFCIQKYIQDKIYFNLKHDLVTGLANHDYLLEELQKLTQNPSEETFSLMMIKIDQFEEINNSMGINVVNDLLKEFSSRILSEPQETLYMVFKLENDSFAIILKKISSASDVLDYSKNLIEKIKKPFLINKQDIYITLSIGFSLFQNQGEDDQKMIMKAKYGLKKASASGGNAIEYGPSSIQESNNQSILIEFSLRKALDRNEFLLYYQPKVNFNSGNIVGLEALIRWNDPKYGIRPPDYFIEIAEQSDLIISISEWVFRQVCREIKEHDLGIPISLNMSAKQLNKQDNYLNFVKNTIQEFNVDPEKIELEITESILVQGNEVIETLKKIQKLGINISFDDFGTKYCSLNYLRNFIPNTIKIDKSFIDGIPESNTNMAIIKSIISLCKDLKIKTVGEGAESLKQVGYLINSGCDDLQSYYISKPIPFTEIQRMINMNFKSKFIKSL